MGIGIVTRVLFATAVVRDLLTFLIISDGSTTGAVIRVVNRLLRGDIVAVLGPRIAVEFPQKPDVPPLVASRREEESVSPEVPLDERRCTVPLVALRVLNQNLVADCQWLSQG